MSRALALALLAGCAGARTTTLASGGLGYDVDAAGDRVAAILLDSQFRLAIYDGLRERARHPLGDAAYDCGDLSLSRDGARAAVACRDGRVRIVDTATGQTLLALRLDGAATAVTFAANDTLLVTGSATGVLCVRRVTDGALLQCVAEHGGELAALAARGEVLASGAHDGSVARWQLPSLRLVARERFAGAVTALALSPDGRRTAVGLADRPPRLPARGRGELRFLGEPGKTPLAAAPAAIAWVGGEVAVATWTPALLVGGKAVHQPFRHILRGIAVIPGGLVVAGFAPPAGGPVLVRVDVLSAR